MPAQIPKSEMRSFERVSEHYRIEKALAARLRSAAKEERRELYTAVYDELFRSVPDHPQLALKANRALRAGEVSLRLKMLSGYLHPELIYLEVGPGDCALAMAVAERVRQVYAVDVSHEIVAGVTALENLELVISDGRSIPVPANSVDLAYSDQLMEHLHPEDAREQLDNIYQALKPGGVYLCLTPNRWSGPHDVSRYFDEVATGFHLREYTVAELVRLFRSAGFRRFKVLVGGGGFHLPVPTLLIEMVERFLSVLPASFGRTLARGLPLRLLLGVKLVATK